MTDEMQKVLDGLMKRGVPPDVIVEIMRELEWAFEIVSRPGRLTFAQTWRGDGPEPVRYYAAEEQTMREAVYGATRTALAS